MQIILVLINYLYTHIGAFIIFFLGTKSLIFNSYSLRVLGILIFLGAFQFSYGQKTCTLQVHGDTKWSQGNWVCSEGEAPVKSGVFEGDIIIDNFQENEQLFLDLNLEIQGDLRINICFGKPEIKLLDGNKLDVKGDMILGECDPTPTGKTPE